MKMKKMNKKGFTLIELLAIIVILAIIAVITVPLILNIIDDAKKGAERNSVIGYGKAIELAYTQSLWDQELNGSGTGVEGKTVQLEISNASGATSTEKDVNVIFEGSAVDCETHKMVAGRLNLTGCHLVEGGSGATYTYDSGKAFEE